MRKRKEFEELLKELGMWYTLKSDPEFGIWEIAFWYLGTNYDQEGVLVAHEKLSDAIEEAFAILKEKLWVKR